MSNNAKAKLIAKIGASSVALVIPLVVYYEGVVLRTYADPINKITACTGHTGPELRMGQSYTKEQCETMLYGDLLKHADALNCIKTPLADNQKAAFLSFAFNVGNGAFCKSTLARKANAGDLMGACAELSRWVMAGGRVLPGLVKRRAAERQLCEKGLE
jgi:lysozyme